MQAFSLVVLLALSGFPTRAEEVHDTVLGRVRLFLSTVPAVPGIPIRYNVTAACWDRESRSGLIGLCRPQVPKCVNPAGCAINPNAWNWPLPQDERDFVATYMEGGVFRAEPGVCDTESKSYPISWVPQQNGGVQHERIEATIMKTVPVCCAGYELTSDLHCMPLCSPECKNGHCSAPNTCQCDAGFAYAEGNNSQCYPVCPQGCTDGGKNSSIPCPSPSNCLCPPGYTRDENNLRCSPVCPSGCRKVINCTAPISCKCLEKDYGTPPDSHCSVPIICRCPLGFILDRDNQCVPIMLLFCNKINSTNCRPSMNCWCPEGYNPDAEQTKCVSQSPGICLDGGTCWRKECNCPEGFAPNGEETICQSTSLTTCDRFKCSTPAKCTCPTFTEPADNNTKCVRVERIRPGRPREVPITCECPKDFSFHPKNGSQCISFSNVACNKNKIVKCRGQKECICPKRYTRTLDKRQCLPPCPKEGPFLFCNPSDFCYCPPGFYCNKGSSECSPYCSKGCPNGKCTKPEHCTCNDGYKNNDAGVCVAHCPDACKNADCTSPGVCTCHRGYKKHPHHDHICEPHCSSGCPNGRCVAPEECKCKEEFYKNNHGECVPMCPLGCNYAKCTGINKCTCLSGYEPVPGDKRSCIPVCHPECDNGRCVAPNRCECNPGYSLDKKKRCSPHCEPHCTNGVCRSPNTCACYDGYHMDPYRPNVCVSNCDRPCVNGVCHSINECTCNVGFRKDRYDSYNCIPTHGYSCSPSCINGNCTATNVCTCYRGFQKVPHEPHKCVAPCSGDCINGNCVGPNQCVCRSGYIQDYSHPNGVKCDAMCDPPCYNAICSSPNKCICQQGYVKDLNVPERNVCIPR